MAETTPDLGLPPAPLPAPNSASAVAEVVERADSVWTRRSATPGEAPGVRGGAAIAAGPPAAPRGADGWAPDGRGAVELFLDLAAR